MIPKRIFFYWGNETMSWMRYMTLYSFRKMNPDWRITVYYSTDNVNYKTWKSFETQDFCNFIGENYINRLYDLNITFKEWHLSDNKIVKLDSNLNMGASHKSNFLKWSKLYEDGGIYSDLDILYFKPIDNFYNTLVNYKFDTAICQQNFLSIGLLAAKQNNNFFKDIFINAIKYLDIKEYQSAGVDSIYNLYSNIEIWNILNEAKKIYPHLNFYNIPMNLVYFFTHNDVVRLIENSYKIENFPEEAIGYHWYAGHPRIQEYNNILTEHNYKNHSITFCKIAQQILES